MDGLLFYTRKRSLSIVFSAKFALYLPIERAYNVREKIKKGTFHVASQNRMVKGHTLSMFVKLTLVFFVLLWGHEGHATEQKVIVGKIAQNYREFPAFVDGFIEANMQRSGVSGMAFVAVKDGEILYSRGYGKTQRVKGAPINPQTTIFRLGSISKLLTATAALQMVAGERLEMDRDINEYLKNWSISPTFTPITLRHLLSHTAGLDERRTLINAISSRDERNFSRRIPALMPARSFPPDSVYSYSNMGYALLGSIIERYSRQPFNRMIERKILEPLEMRNSGFILTEPQMSLLAQGHNRAGDKIPYKHYYVLPALGFSSTAEDMAHFMIAQLQYGKYKRRYILPEKYARGLFTVQFSPDKAINGTALGYYQYRSGGVEAFAHHGDLDGFSSLVVLVPADNFGFFMVANTENFDFRDSLATAILNRFPLTRLSTPTVISKSVSHVNVEGSYRHNRISRHTAEKAFEILGEEIRVERAPDGVLLWLPPSLGGGEENWRKTDNALLFERENGERHLLFVTDESGNVISMTRNGVYMTYDKVPWLESFFAQKSQLVLFALSLFFSLGGLCLALAVNRGRLPWEREGAMIELWVIASLFALSQLAFGVGLVVSRNLYSALFAYTIPFRVKALFLVPIVGCLLLLWFWVRFFSYLINPFYSFLEKVVLLVLGLVAVRWVFFLLDWNLLGFRF